MCFIINHRIRRSTRRTAYKLVQVHRRTSRVSSLVHNSKYWEPGVHHCSVGPITSRGGRYAECGIYVYNTLAAAYKALRRKYSGNYRGWFTRPWHTYDLVIMKVIVEPADFLFQSNGEDDQDVSTYRRVTVPEEQPYMEWY